MHTDTFEALQAAGFDIKQATVPATAIPDIEPLRSEMDLRFTGLRGDMDVRFADLRAGMDRHGAPAQHADLDDRGCPGHPPGGRQPLGLKPGAHRCRPGPGSPSARPWRNGSAA